ncbi:3'-5' exonuclease [Acrocarpospora corrugata]|uniref:3'-5' exonuclease n=1 Tax=Acrocarpospora corrugata TaxID=35763 RepID=A0A5M3VUU6_9ACTN|nr:exonuclease domain-containing protein [Acrocarpospora corrugata]GER99451.1 3'-5' exonuclease [Acrocarpospora corrugata]
MSWADGRLCGFDVETTGAGQEAARIVAVTIVFVGDGQPADVTAALVDPGMEIPAEATAVHGITTERARSEGLKPVEAVRMIVDRLERAWGAGRPVIGFNIAYDLTVLDRELRRHLGSGLNVTGPVVDPHVIDRALDRRKGKRTLEETCRHYKVRHETAHDATQDALAAARLAWRLARSYPAEVGDLTLAELHRREMDWSREWATRLNEYWRSQGKDNSIDGSWPVRPYRAEN